MSNNQEISALLLIEDLGMLYATQKSTQKSHFAIYKCQCGKEFKSLIASVKNGKTKSCGCYKISMVIERSTKHGLYHHPLHSVWSHMIERTVNKNHKHFKDYGGRGILVCEDWSNNFKSFYDFCINNGWERGLEIDRRDNNKGYSPDNCRFVTSSINSQNTRLIHAHNTSGFRGVTFNKKSNKWVARILNNGENKYLGSFNTAIDGAKAYDTYVIENNFEHPINRVL